LSGVRRLRSGYLKGRLLGSVLVFIAVYLLNFILPRLEPGNFVSALGQQFLTHEQRQRILAMFGLNEPPWVQFVKYVEQTFLSFPPNYGVSFSHYPLSVWTVVMAYLPWTLLLIVTSQLIAWSTGILLGAWLGWRQGPRSNSLMLGVSTFMWGVPSYWLATILIFVFAIRLHFFPPALTGVEAVTSFNLAWVATVLNHAFLPILTLVILNLPAHATVMRNTMVSLKQEDFMIAAEARGLRSRTLILGHAARNALLPSVTRLALTFGDILSGAYLVEIIYSYPGMGYLTAQSVFSRDYPVLQGVFFFSALLVIVANILADIAYVFLDPRVEYVS